MWDAADVAIENSVTRNLTTLNDIVYLLVLSSFLGHGYLLVNSRSWVY